MAAAATCSRREGLRLVWLVLERHMTGLTPQLSVASPVTAHTPTIPSRRPGLSGAPHTGTHLLQVTWAEAGLARREQPLCTLGTGLPSLVGNARERTCRATGRVGGFFVISQLLMS